MKQIMRQEWPTILVALVLFALMWSYAQKVDHEVLQQMQMEERR